MQLARSRADLASGLEALDTPLALVPTMGALHDGHAALITAAREFSVATVVSIFVNPLQFGPGEDLGSYPRTLDADLARCKLAGVDLVWAPAVADVYPDGQVRVRVDPGPLGVELEGAARPGHFAGALTVVAKLLNLVRPAVAMFGEKDYQQLTLVRRMVGDLELGIGIAGIPTVRESDGLALSSRNRFLSEDDRRRARALSQALFAGQDAARGGAPAVLSAARAVLDAADGVAVDYLELRNPDLGPAPVSGPARLLVAGWVGGVRLIDNMAVQL